MVPSPLRFDGTWQIDDGLFHIEGARRLLTDGPIDGHLVPGDRDKAKPLVRFSPQHAWRDLLTAET